MIIIEFLFHMLDTSTQKSVSFLYYQVFSSLCSFFFFSSLCKTVLMILLTPLSLRLYLLLLHKISLIFLIQIRMMLLYFANGFTDDSHGKYDVEYMCYTQVYILMNEQFTFQVSLYLGQR